MRLAFNNGSAYVPGRYHPGLYYRGIGALTTTDIIGSGTNAAIQGYGTAKATSPVIGAAVAGTSLAATLMTLSAAAGPFAPFVALAAGLIGPIASMFKGCGQTCVQATQIADKSEAAANQLFDAWNAMPVHYHSVQQAYLAAIDDVQRYLFGACSSPQLGDAGRRCVSERQRGGVWDFFAHYVDPVANAKDIVPDPVDPNSVQGVAQSVASAVRNIPMPVILAGAGILVLVLSSGDSK